MTEQSMDPLEVLKRETRILARLRAELAVHENELLLFREAVEATNQWKEFLAVQEAIAQVKASIEAQDGQLREIAIDVAAELGIRRPTDAIEVIERIRFVILDEAEALSWARTNLVASLTLDVKVFQKFILAMPEAQRPAFIFVGKDPAVRIAGDLSAYLAEGDDDAVEAPPGTEPD